MILQICGDHRVLAGKETRLSPYVVFRCLRRRALPWIAESEKPSAPQRSRPRKTMVRPTGETD